MDEHTKKQLETLIGVERTATLKAEIETLKPMTPQQREQYFESKHNSPPQK